MTLLEETLQPLASDTLVAMLRVLQARLGTSGEEADDMELVRAIAHRLNNLSCAAVFAHGVAGEPWVG